MSEWGSHNGRLLRVLNLLSCCIERILANKKKGYACVKPSPPPPLPHTHTHTPVLSSAS